MTPEPLYGIWDNREERFVSPVPISAAEALISSVYHDSKAATCAPERYPFSVHQRCLVHPDHRKIYCPKEH